MALHPQQHLLFRVGFGVSGFGFRVSGVGFKICPRLQSLNAKGFRVCRTYKTDSRACGGRGRGGAKN